MRKTIHQTFCPMPGLEGGFLRRADLDRLIQIVRKYDIPLTKVTGAQRFFFHGIDPEKMPALKAELNLPAAPPHTSGKLHYIQACPGPKWCAHGRRETEKITEKLNALALDTPLPYKVKAAVSGCHMSCCESWLRDIGLIGRGNGWRFIFGGNAGSQPRIGEVVEDGLSDDDAIELIGKTLRFYAATAREPLRSARFMETVGMENLKKNVLG